jgi:hypothetical protein
MVAHAGWGSLGPPSPYYSVHGSVRDEDLYPRELIGGMRNLELR